MNKKRIKVLVADDNYLIRNTLQNLFYDHPAIRIIGEAADGEEVLQMAGLKPDVILMDINIPGTDGITLTRKILKQYPEIRIVAFSLNHKSEYVTGMIEAGAKGYVYKTDGFDHLEIAIKKAVADETYHSPVAAEALRKYSGMIETLALAIGGTINGLAG